MEKWKAVGKKLLFVPGWMLIVLIFFSTAALLIIFIQDWSVSPAAYAVYVISFYTVVVSCFACCKTLPEYYKNIKAKVYENQYANRYLTDAAYKTEISLHISFTFNLLYVATNAVSAALYHTAWFAIFAIYYGIMAMMRFLLVRYVGKNQLGESYLGELKRSRACAYILLTVNLVLSGVVLMMVYYNRSFHYQGVLIYVMAIYTFYATASAITALVKYQKYHSPVMSVSKVIKLTQSMFSMLFLETAMFAQFGQDTSLKTRRIMIMATGAGVSIIVVGMAIYMIVRTTKKIRNFQKEERK